MIKSSGQVNLFWIPLGAGGHFVHFNGTVYEAVSARRDGRPRRDLFHSALEVRLSDGRWIIEMAWPIPKGPGSERGAVVQGPVFWKWAARFRWLRYEIRCWPDGDIPDSGYAIGSPVRVSDDEDTARRILALAPLVPPLIWGSDELAAGDMWNSNSCIAWLLERSGIDTSGIHPPHGGRAPGWDAGLFAGRRAAPRGTPSSLALARPQCTDLHERIHT